MSMSIDYVASTSLAIAEGILSSIREKYRRLLFRTGSIRNSFKIAASTRNNERKTSVSFSLLARFATETAHSRQEYESRDYQSKQNREKPTAQNTHYCPPYKQIIPRTIYSHYHHVYPIKESGSSLLRTRNPTRYDNYPLFTRFLGSSRQKPARAYPKDLARMQSLAFIFVLFVNVNGTRGTGVYRDYSVLRGLV